VRKLPAFEGGGSAAAYSLWDWVRRWKGFNLGGVVCMVVEKKTVMVSSKRVRTG
jgi:hypothetical protein